MLHRYISLYMYIACNFELKLGKGTMYMFVYAHTQGMTDSEGKKETTLS